MAARMTSSKTTCTSYRHRLCFGSVVEDVSSRRPVTVVMWIHVVCFMLVLSRHRVLVCRCVFNNLWGSVYCDSRADVGGSSSDLSAVLMDVFRTVASTHGLSRPHHTCHESALTFCDDVIQVYFQHYITWGSRWRSGYDSIDVSV